MAQGEALRLISIAKRYGDVVALEALDLDVGPGEIVALTGPSGAGKTTTCRLISGIEAPDAGEIRLGARRLDELSAQDRHVSYMFESYALYPQLSVRDNVAFPLRAPGRRMRHDERAIAARVDEVLELVEMAALAERMPAELSGGQKQRVALCRALVQDPSAFLLDEPISHLDAKLRHKLRGAIRRRLRQTGVPTLWCSPDGLEALSVADRVAVLIGGRLEQVDTPTRVYLAPASVRVARLLGDPPTNLLEGELGRAQDRLVFRCDGLSIELPDASRAGARQSRASRGRARDPADRAHGRPGDPPPTAPRQRSTRSSRSENTRSPRFSSAAACSRPNPSTRCRCVPAIRSGSGSRARLSCYSIARPVRRFNEARAQTQGGAT